ncbi:hypothetical protein GJAV_G00264250 [Gymnothorax javanicus]|nr:hypothetical protein GJAV_G00264250 [Gymnothorax javanicus]
MSCSLWHLVFHLSFHRRTSKWFSGVKAHLFEGFRHCHGITTIRGEIVHDRYSWTVNMKNPSWMRRNWLWVAGGAFVSIHFGTWVMQRAMKSSVRSQTQGKRSVED